MMENQFHMNEEELQKLEKSHRRGKIMGGLLVIAAGSLFLARELGAQIPAWVFTWKVVLIALGLVIAVKHKFKHAFWFFMVLIGGVCLMADLYPNVQIKAFVWPSLLILLGIFIVFKPRNKHRQQHCRAKWQRRQRFRNKYETYPVLPGEESSDDRVEFTTFMGAVRKIVISKNFKSAEVTNVFGGTELNLMQADFEDKASMEIT